MSGWEWMYSFLKNRCKINIQKEENIFINSALRMRRSKLRIFFKILERKMTELFLPKKHIE
jgi:hypothetical protein